LKQSPDKTKTFAIAMHFAFNNHADDYRKSLSNNLNIFTKGLIKAGPIALDGAISLSQAPVRISENLGTTIGLYREKIANFTIDLPNKMTNFGHFVIKESHSDFERTRMAIDNSIPVIRDTIAGIPGEFKILASNLLKKVSEPIAISIFEMGGEINSKITKGKENIGETIKEAPIYLSLALNQRMGDVSKGGEQVASLIRGPDSFLNNALNKVSLGFYCSINYFLDLNSLCPERVQETRIVEREVPTKKKPGLLKPSLLLKKNHPCH
jgi:hypothetical protein